MFTNHIYLIYMNKEDLVLYNLQWFDLMAYQPNLMLNSNS